MPSPPASRRPGDGGGTEQSMVPLPPRAAPPSQPTAAAQEELPEAPPLIARGESTAARGGYRRKGKEPGGTSGKMSLSFPAQEYAQAILWHWSHCCCIDFQAFLSPSLNSWFFSHLTWMESAWRNGMSSHGIQSVLQRGGRSSSLASLQTGPATYWITYKLCVLVLHQNIPFYCLWNPILISPRVLIVNFSTFICILSLCANSFPAVVNIFRFSFCIDGAVNSNLIHSIFGKTS